MTFGRFLAENTNQAPLPKLNSRKGDSLVDFIKKKKKRDNFLNEGKRKPGRAKGSSWCELTAGRQRRETFPRWYLFPLLTWRRGPGHFRVKTVLPVIALSSWVYISWKSCLRVLSDLTFLWEEVFTQAYRDAYRIIWSIHCFLDISIPVRMWNSWNYQNIGIKPYTKCDTVVCEWRGLGFSAAVTNHYHQSPAWNQAQEGGIPLFFCNGGEKKGKQKKES